MRWIHVPGRRSPTVAQMVFPGGQLTVCEYVVSPPPPRQSPSTRVPLSCTAAIAAVRLSTSSSMTAVFDGQGREVGVRVIVGELVGVPVAEGDAVLVAVGPGAAIAITAATTLAAVWVFGGVKMPTITARSEGGRSLCAQAPGAESSSTAHTRTHEPTETRARVSRPGTSSFPRIN